MKCRIRLVWVLLLCAAMLTACGGGGGSPSGSDGPVDVGDGSGDTGGDAGGDAGGDTGGDAGGDAGGDTGGDAGGDTGGDTGGDDPVPAFYRLSGTIQVAQGTAVDGDVNDPEAPYLGNDTVGTAQPIPNPVSVGGYVNQPASGAAGRSQTGGDVSDIYRVTLAANQSISLHIADSQAGDLDLFLGNQAGELVDSSEGVGDTESLVAPASGTYLLEVYAYEGASNYVLSIGQDFATADTTALRSADAFVPGEVIVQFRDRVLPASAGEDATLSVEQIMGLRAKAGAPGRPLLMATGSKVQRAEAFTALGIADRERGPVLAAHAGAAEQHAKRDTLQIVKALRKRGDVLRAEPNYIRSPATTIPNDQYYPAQWHYPIINLPAAWDISTGSGAVSVAVIDTGVLLAHPDLQGQLLPGYDFVSDPERALDGDGLDANPDDPGDGGYVGVSSFHGTHVTGTIAAASNNDTGVSGVAWGARIMPLRALGEGGGTSYDILQAVRYAAGLSNDSGTLPAQRADIINLSLGGSGYSQFAQEVYTQARAQGVVIVAAAGNEGSSVPVYPASYDGVISVSAVDMNRDLASYSSFGPYVDLSAPGGDVSGDRDGDGYPDGILSTMGSDAGGNLVMNYGFAEGTSMATPHVSGVVALMKSVNPGLSPNQLDSLLAAGALTVDLGAPGRDDYYGHGLIDARKAVMAAQGIDEGEADPVLAVHPVALNFGLGINSIRLTATNGGGGSLSVTSPAAAEDWLAVNPLSVTADGLGEYEVTVNRLDLPGGTYTATIAFVSSANTVNIPVIMQVDSSDVAGDAGRHYVLLVDPVDGAAVAQVSANAEDGLYHYSFDGIPEGSYLVLSGTDSNNDGFICDAGEACGAYLSLDQVKTIAVGADTDGLDFSTAFGVRFGSQVNGIQDDMPTGYRRIQLKHVAK